MKSAALTAVLALAIAAPVAAQAPTPRHATSGQRMTHTARQGTGGMQGASMRCSVTAAWMHDRAMGEAMGQIVGEMPESADRVLADKTVLRLTADQEHRIMSIRDETRTQYDNALRDATHHEQELDEVMRAATPDTVQMKAHFDAAQSALAQAHYAVLRSAALTRAELTDAQRRQVDRWEAATGCEPAAGPAQASHGQ